MTSVVPESVLGTSPTEIGKRTKASRACDECRRKKIRCDIGESSLCTSCQRLGTLCTFSRVQLKRGPSKRQRSQSDVQSAKNLLPGINALLNWTPQPKFRGPLSPPHDIAPQMAAQQAAQQHAVALHPVSSPPTMAPSYHPYRRPSLPAPINAPSSPTLASLSPTALNYYYAHWHPLLPILPDTPAELGALLRDSNNHQCLVTAINGTTTSVLIEPAYGVARITQLMALIFVYCNTTEPTWLGAAAANAMALPADSIIARRLFFIVAVLDRLHAGVFGTNKLLGLEAEAPVQDLARMYLWGEQYARGASTPPPDSVQEISAMAMHCLVDNDRRGLELLAPQLKDTPFSALISRALNP